jgi:hypothetical protein
MLNYPVGLAFSETLSDKRLKKARASLGTNVIGRIIAYALFLFGAKREDIAQYLHMPLGTLFSFLTRADRYGILAFEDRRKSLAIETVKAETPLKVTLDVTEESFTIQLSRDEEAIRIPRENMLQCKVVLLSFLNSGLLSAKEISEALAFSERHTRDLKNRLYDQDAYCLIDKRKGQLQNYRFTPDVKAELIQQVAANAVTKKPTSSRVISEQVNKRCGLNLTDRSVRLHMKNLGLPRISKSLPTLIEDLKKNSEK